VNATKIQWPLNLRARIDLEIRLDEPTKQ